MKKLLFLLLALLLPAYAQAATYWVSTSGTDGQCTNSATPQTTGAERTVNAGIGCLAGGDTLYVRTGTYVQPIVTVPSGTALPAYPATTGATVISTYNNEVVTLTDPGTSTAFLYYPSAAQRYIVLNGFIWDGAGLLGGSDHVRFSNNEVKNHIDNGFSGANHNEYQHNRVHDNGADSGGGPPQGHGMYISGPDNLIEDNEIYSNWGCGIHLHSNLNENHRNIIRRNVVHDNGVAAGCVGILVDQGNDNQVYNNLVYNHNNGQGIFVYNGAVGTLVYNNTLYNNTGASQLETSVNSSGAVVKNNILHPGPGGIAGVFFTDAGSGTTSSNNLCTTTCGFGSSNQAEAAATTFTTPGSNFHIKAGSLAINNGTNLGSTYSPDIADVARPTSGAWEIGAYEFTAATDAFARSNGALGTNWLSGYTGQTAGAIVSEQVQGTTLNSNAIQVWSTPATSDHAGSVTLAALSDPSGGDVAVILRASAPPTATFYYIAASIGTASSTYINRCEAGSCTSPASDNSVVWAAGDTLRATAVGETISVYRNGSLVFTYADTIPLRGNYVGFGSFAVSDLATMAADNFLIESLGGPVMHIVKIGAGQTLKIGLQ